MQLVQVNKSRWAITTYLQVITFAILILYFGKSLFEPIFYGLFIAIITYPMCRWMEAKGISRSIAITICIVMIFMLLALLMTLLIWQVNAFRQDLPKLEEKILPQIPLLQNWLQEHFLITLKMQGDWLQKMKNTLPDSIPQLLQRTLYATTSTLFMLFMIPVHAALFLYHRGTFVRFLHRVIGNKYRLKVKAVLSEVIDTYFNFIKGMVFVYIIVGVLNSVGLLILGIRHAILFGMLTAIMTIIPYVGIFISAALPVAVSYIMTGSLWYPAGVIFVFSFVQYLEANVIFPRVVGAQLNVSTWATLIAIIAGGILWGVSGMILFIPIVAILKIVSDHFKELAALNILLKRD